MAVIAVETIAAAALRARLRSHGKVAVSVTASAWDLLAGRVGGAKVEGRLWESPLGLTARVLDVQVGLVELDLPAVFAQQRIVLRNTPVGSARVVFNADDFGAFLQHPLVTTAARRAVQGRPFLFDREGVVIAPGSRGSDGCVLFSGLLPASGQRYQLTMRPARGGRAVAVAATPVGAARDIPSGGGAAPTATQGGQQQQAVRSTSSAAGAAAGPLGAVSLATAGSGDEDPLVSGELSRFFSGLLVDLQGAELAFSSMRVYGGSAAGSRRVSGSSGEASVAGSEAVLELDLRATVRSFPPLNLQF
ncbi:hypothetical protein PLESTB_000524000 [Pleodorina starrii]|uniref:Uncharacterized protein n=1 Tax=Pleodorina starrii TaxID=330485 RepID=A0A9W6BH15_9CHLO|nr:hypothetical protein PLESTM_000387400 [Pleodorina starrii]GLC51638.1 hypothetical protein PLESTB_000524000 [Pleodorina starrii]